jgi:broad specificity phosphatase PhoE
LQFRIPHSAFRIVNWFSTVDDTYRADLREMNELNFGRFDAKLEQRLAELDAKWGGRWTELDAKWDGRWTQLDAKLEQRLAELWAELVKELADVKSGLKWMLAFWAPQRWP